MTPPFNPADPRNIVDAGRKDSLATWQAFFGMLEQSTDRYSARSDWGKAPADEAFVYAAVRLRALAASSVPLRVYVKQGHNLIPSDLASDKDAAELQHLLDFVNPDSMSNSDFKATIVASLSVYGEAYLVKTRGRLGGRPQELHFLNPSVVRPVIGERWIDAYEYRPIGTAKMATYLPKDIVPFRTPGNFIDPTRGLSPMSAIREEIGTSRMATEHTNNQIRNHGIPAGVWVVPKDTEVTPQDQSAIRRVLASLRGPRNAGKTAVLPGGLTWQNLGLPEADAQYLHARKISRMAIAAAFGIPLALLGDDEKTAVYRSIRDAEEIFWRRFSTELEWAASVLDSWLTPEFDKTGDRLTIRFDTSAVQALRPTLQEQTTLWQALLNLGVATPNEARAHFGIGAPTDWGDKPLLTLQVAQQAAEGETPQVAEPLPISEPSDSPESQPIVAGASAIVLPNDLYKHDAVKSFLKGEALNYDALLNVSLTATQKILLETAIKRRYNVEQIINGVPGEGFAGLEGAAQ
jgi:HK97 family phage portal protein